MKLSDNLKAIRRDNNLSQEQLAEKLGVSRQAVSKWESGQSYPEMDKVLLICKLFNYNIDELMNENVKEVEENKQAKSNINKYVEDFFGFITKTIDMFSSMKFRQKVKCIFEQCVITGILVLLFVVIGFIGSEILWNLFGSFGEEFYYGIRGIFEAIYLVFVFISGTTILLHIFKTRYLDYYEIVKEYGEQETKTDEPSKKEEAENYNEKHKVFIEKKKEKIIIRDPNHSNSKFLTGLFRILLAFIKLMTLGVGVAFAITFVALFVLFIFSFMFVKTGVLFVGAVLLILALALGNFVILELIYNFVTNKKTKKTRIGIMLLVALVVTGISIGFILIGITDFKVIEDNSSSFEIEEVYEYEMTDNLSLYSYNCAYRYVETNSNNIKVIVRHTKYTETSIYNENDVIDIYCHVNDMKTVELIKQIITDLNNKELRDYPNCAEVYIYASRENIDKIQKNNIEKHRYNQEYIIQRYMNECENLRNQVYDLQEDIIRYKEEIDNLNDTIKEYQIVE